MMKTDTPRPIRLKNYKPSAFLIDKVDLDFSLDPERTVVRSRLKLHANPAATGTPKELRLDGERLELLSVRLDGKLLKPGDYRVTDTELVIPDVPVKKPFRLEIESAINPEANTELQGLYRSRGIYCTQCEAEGFRRITYFLDRPDVLARYKVRIEADADTAPVLLSNGNHLERGTLENGRRHYAIWKDPHPKPSYLFALVGGDLRSIASTFTTRTGRQVDLRIYVEPGKEDRCGWAMDSLKRSMKWDEERFGCEYDLDVFNIVAVSDFNMGAMENKGLNIFNDRLILASPETATDGIYQAIESVVAHEYFHNWTGNRITCRDWFQLCLKEGLTVFRDQEFSADERDATVERINSVRDLRSHQFPEDAGPLAHPVRPSSYIEINNFYTATVYEKGAELVRMIQTICGRDGFRAGMDLYLSRHDGDAATVEDFIACFEEAARVDLAQFQNWYRQAGTPELVCDLKYDQKSQTAELSVEQVLPPTPGEPRKRALHIPFKIGLLGGNGQDIPLELASGEAVPDGVLHLTRRSQKFKFKNVPSHPVPSYLRGFSAPVNLTAHSTDRDLTFLMANDSDLFARWQATTDYATRILVQLAKAQEPKVHLTRVKTFAEALKASLSDSSLSDSYRAELMRLPSEGDIAREIGQNVDPAKIHTARRLALKTIGQVAGQILEEIYSGAASKGTFSPLQDDAGRRSLRNAALSLLSARDTQADKARLKTHFTDADNMSEQAHGLYLLAASSGRDREQALAAFYKQWKDDHLVVDTWFAAQAMAPFAATTSRVRKLLKHEKFSLKTPNKVRALIGTFALQNPSQFNRADGAGYRLVADQVLHLDKINPQVAARLLNAFRSWRTMEPGRRALAKEALSQIANTSGLSRDVYEIASKMIEAE
jgi:aminopeptidase N